MISKQAQIQDGKTKITCQIFYVYEYHKSLGVNDQNLKSSGPNFFILKISWVKFYFRRVTC